MDKFSLADLYEQDTVSPSGPQLTPSLADLYELSGAGTQQPPVVDGGGVSSPPAPNTSAPTDLVLDPVLSGANTQPGFDAQRRRQSRNDNPPDDLTSGGRNNPARSDVYTGPVDPAGYPIDTSRPLVMVGEGDNRNIATEMTATVPGTALGMPMEGVFFNIPTVINGVPMSPEAAAQLTGKLIAAGEINLDDIPRFNSQEEAGAAALARSQAIGELRADEIKLFGEQDRVSRVMDKPGPTIEKANLNRNPSVSGVTGVPGKYTLTSPLGDVPIDDETATTLIAKGNTFEMPNNALVRGVGRLNQAFNVLGLELGLKSPEDFVRNMMELDRLYPDAPPEVQKGLQEITEAKGFSDSLSAIANNPQAVLSVVAESLVVSAPSLAAFITGSVVGTPVTGTAVAGTMTFGTTYASVITDEIRSSGVNMDDEAAIMELMSDRDFWQRAQKRGTAYGVPIAVFDALSMGLAGKLVAGGVQAGKSGINIAGRAVTETGLQMSLGAAGETAGQASEMAFGFRDTFTPGEIALEAVAEGPLGIAEIAVGTPGNIKAARENAFNNELEAAQSQAEAEFINRHVTNLLGTNTPTFSPEFVDPSGPVTETRSVKEQFEALIASVEAIGTDEAMSLAKGMRGSVQMKTADMSGISTNPNFTPRPPKTEEEAMLDVLNSDFYPQRIAEIKARADGTESPITPDGDYWMVWFKDDPKEMKKLEDIKSVPLVSGALEAARERVNQLAAEINEAGYTVEQITNAPNIPPELRAKKSIIMSLGGLSSRLVNQATSIARGYKRADQNKLEATIDEMYSEIGGTQGRPSASMLGSMRAAGEDVSQFVASEAKPDTINSYFGETPVAQEYKRQRVSESLVEWLTAPEKLEQLTDEEIAIILDPNVTFPAKDKFADRIKLVQEERDRRAAANTPVEAPTTTEIPPATTEVRPATTELPPAPKPAEPIAIDNPQQVTEPVGTSVNQEQPVIKTVQTPDSQANYEVETVVVELSDLKQAQGILQPRDRSLAESTVEAQRRASPDQFNPDRLLDSPTTGDGAPIIARDGTIMSGNGRVLTLQEVYGNQPSSRAAYTQALQTAGVNLEGFSQPVLVRRLTDTNMTVDDLKTFADLANTDAQARMSTTESAQRDAQRMPPEVVNLYTGGDLTSLDNRAFVDAFVSQVLSPTEQGQFSRDGKLTKDAVGRMQAAILATAYEDTDALAIMLDSTDDNIKAISNAMMSTAPRVSQLKADIKAGTVKPEFDISPQIAEAAKTISSLRDRGIKPRDYFAQQDAFSDGDPIVEAIIKAFYNDELTRAKSQKFMQDVLDFYVEESGNRQANALFEDDTTPTDVVRAARSRAERKADGTEGQGSLLPESGPSDRIETSREQAQGGRSARRSEDVGRRQIESRDRTERQVDDSRLESTLETGEQADAAARDVIDSTFDPAEVVLREDGEGNTRGTKSGRVLTQEVQTLRQSVYNQAFRDAGVDPALARNMTPERQFKILSDLVMDKFGFKYIARPETNSYDANQALLDAYRNLQWMTHSIGLPYSAIGLDNSLGLALPGRQWGGYLAAFIQSKAGPAAATMSDVGRVPAPVIIMPKRSNSFAHEWGHALDYHIVEKYGADEGRGITGRIRTNLKADERVWLENAPQNVQEAMGDLMNAMFFDKAEMSYKIMELEQQLAKTRAYEAKTGKTTKKAAALEEQLRKLREGSTRTKISQTLYRKEAEEFAVAAQSDVDYWTRPTEMFARAFEAYVAKQVTDNGGNTEFITKSDEAYSMTRDQVEGADIRLALTYPNDVDRNNIFLAMDRLMQELQAEMWTDAAAADAPGNYDLLDARVEFAAQIKEGMSKSAVKEIVAQEKAGWRAREQQIKNEKNRPVRYAELGTGKIASLRRFSRNVEDRVISRVMYAKRGILFSIEGRYNDNKPVQNIINDLISRVATDPGGRRKTFEGGTFEEATTLASRRFANTYKAIIDKYNLSELSTEELNKLRLILTADPEAQAAAARGASPVLLQAAGEIRTKLLNPMYDYMRNGGVEITYLQNGSYMPRMLDGAKVEQEEAQFLYGESGQKNPASKRGAYAMYYNVIYENELGQYTEGDLDQAQNLVNLGRKLALDEETADSVGELRRMLNEMRKLMDDPDGNEAQIGQLQDEINELHETVYEELRDPFAEVSAQDWYTRISVQAGADPEAHAAQNRFTQKRKLPPEADSYMVDYYLDPVESLNLYIPAVARKTEMEKRFGRGLVPKGKKRGVLGKGPMDTIDFLEYQIQQAQLRGLDNGDAQQLRIVINKILGRDGATKDIFGKKALDYLHTYGTMALLPRAVLSSIAEPLTAGIQTGSVKKGAQTFFQVFDEALGLVSENAKERTLFYRQLANIIGVVDDPSIGQMVANRLGGTLAEDPKLNARLSRFFVRTKLQGLTNAQRRSSMRTMLQFLAEISAEYQDANITPKAKKRIENILQDVGIYGENLDQFTKWMSESKEGQFKAPALDELIGRGGELTDMGNLLAVAVGRLTDQTIQDPKSVDRPMYAEHPVGRMVFGIQSFMRAYTRNVLIASAKKVNREFQDNGMVSATSMLALQMIPNFALLYGGHLLVSTLREALLNGDRLEREREDDNLVPYLMELGFMRAGFYGAFDPWVNMYKSLRYEADSKTILVGASLSFYSRALDRMLGVTNRFRNSPNTVAAEYQAAVGFWDTFVTTGVSALTSMPGPGPIAGTALGGFATFATSPTVKHATIRQFIKLLYGEEYRPGTRSGGRAKQSRGLGTDN